MSMPATHCPDTVEKALKLSYSKGTSESLSLTLSYSLSQSVSHPTEVLAGDRA